MSVSGTVLSRPRGVEVYCHGGVVPVVWAVVDDHDPVPRGLDS